VIAVALLLPGLLLATPRGMTDEPACRTHVPVADRASLWAPPLDRSVRLPPTTAPVRTLLDAVAREAGIALSYSAEFLPTTPVCLKAPAAPVGALLEQLLAGTGLRPIVLGSTQVVLAPSVTPPRSPVPDPGPDSALSRRRASVLDRVVVTGSPDGAALRGSPYALELLDGATLAQYGVTTLGEALDLAVPGLWSWTAPAGSVTARYGSIRGASSFGVSAPKIYLDGIEVANPLVVTQLDPARVARVEVIRGPQGAALYGADAISGVINILTRQDGTEDGGTTVQLTTAAGLSATAFAARDAFVQDHSLAVRRGGASRSVGAGLTVGTLGAYVPGASERRVLADASGRVATGQRLYTGTARLALQRANASSGLMFDALDRPSIGGGVRAPLAFGGDSATGQDLAQYTVGGSAAFMPSLTWTHTVIAGVDGYRLRGLSSAALPAAVGVASVTPLGIGEGAADRGTLRLRSVGRYDVAPGTLLTVTVAGEHAQTRDVQTSAVAPTLSGRSPGIPGNAPGAVATPPASWPRNTAALIYRNTGVSAQAQLAWKDRWYAVAGLRAERMAGTAPAVQGALLPMLGVAHVRDLPGAVLKVRGAYGSGVRPARSAMRSSSWMGRGDQGVYGGLDPERQSGTELGLDLHVGQRLGLHVTRFDQLASGLIQPVTSLVAWTAANGRAQRAMGYTLQNVGAIENRGWELEGTWRLAPLSLAASWSQVQSTVARTALGYRGELRVGDRMLDVPATTLTVSAAWTAGRLGLTSTVARAANWVGYDRAALSTALANATVASRDVEGASLRRFWMTYDGITRWRASVSYRLFGEVAAVLDGDNLLNVQRGAPDNATVLVGRTLTFGVRTAF